jgi:PTS system nitrogen regulatory IIA component
LQLTDLLTADRVKVPLTGRTKDDVLRELVELAMRARGPAVVESVIGAVREREQLLSTGIGGGIAIPHGKSSELDEVIVAAGVSPSGVEFDALDGRPVTLFFLLVGPESAAGSLVKALSRISRVLRRDGVRESLRGAATGDDFLRVLNGADAA